MEKLILTSQNFTDKKRQGKGSFSLFQKLGKIADFDNVHLDASLPEVDLVLHWEECFTPAVLNSAFMPLLSPKMYAYKFQYFSTFMNGNLKLECGNSESGKSCESYTVKMTEGQVFKSQNCMSDLCNCTWLLDFLFSCEKIVSDPGRNERLIFQEVNDGYEIVLESEQYDKKITERQVFFFQNNFESVSWQHHVNVR